MQTINECQIINDAQQKCTARDNTRKQNNAKQDRVRDKLTDPVPDSLTSQNSNCEH